MKKSHFNTLLTFCVWRFACTAEMEYVFGVGFCFLLFFFFLQYLVLLLLFTRM